MKISYNWLKKYIDLKISPEQVRELLTNCGLEVESLEQFQNIKGGLEGIVIGEVKTCEQHKNADKLWVTTVDVGSGVVLPIVCGAPNVAAGQKVLVAPVNTYLPALGHDFVIKKTKIRGEVSEGMICAEDELGMGSSHEGIIVLHHSATVGLAAKDYYKIENDWIFEIGLTPNRSDATSHLGVARDLLALIKIHYPDNSVELFKPAVSSFNVDNYNRIIDVVVEDAKACPRYSGLTLTGIQVKDSPEWLKSILSSIGIRPINNIVDITNYVLMETGQPLHAFDASKIKGNKVVVKKLKAGTLFKTLDEVKRELTDLDLMICNDAEGMCMAGVFGGIDSGVNENTTEIFLESACFDPKTIRKTSKHHNLKTDASFRFERGTDPNITIYALKRAAIMIKDIAGGEISSPIIDVYPEEILPAIVDVKYYNITRLIGKEIDTKTIKQILVDLGIEILSENNSGLSLAVATNKVDVLREVDIIEEILRIYGYNNIEIGDVLKSSLSYTSNPEPEKTRESISNFLSSLGYSEIMNNSLTRSEYSEKFGFITPEYNVLLLNPLSKDLNVMRQTLVFGILENISHNINHKVHNLKLFEFGRAYQLVNPKAEKVIEKYSEKEKLAFAISGSKVNESWNTEDIAVNIYDLKSLIFKIINRLGINTNLFKLEISNIDLFEYGFNIVYKRQKLVSIGKISKKVLSVFDIKQEVFYAELEWNSIFDLFKISSVQYTEIPKFPEVRRDLALLVDKEINYEEIEKLAFQYETKLLKKVNLFDIYEGNQISAGKKSYAISFILQDFEKTLTDKEIERIMQKLQEAFEEKLGAVLR